MFRRAILTLLSFLFLVPAAYGSAQEDHIPITADNIAQITQLLRLGRGSVEFALMTPDGSTVVAGGTLGVWLYDASALDSQTEPVLLETDGPVRQMALSPDGESLAVTLSNGDVALWDLESHSISGEIDSPTGHYVYDLLYTPGGETLLLNYASDGIYVYDLASSTYEIIDGVYWSSAYAVSADGRRMALTKSDDPAVYIWNLDTMDAGASLHNEWLSAVSVSLSPDGSLAAIASLDYSIRLWDTENASELVLLWWNQREQMREVVFSPDGTRFASGGEFGSILLWDTAAQSEIARISAAGNITDLNFSSDGTKLISVSEDRTVQVWDVASGAELGSTSGHSSLTRTVLFSPDGSSILLADSAGNLSLLDTPQIDRPYSMSVIEGGSGLAAEQSNVASLVYSPGGKLLAIRMGLGTVRIYTASEMDILRDIQAGYRINAFAFSPDETMIAVAMEGWSFEDGLMGLYVFDLTTGEQIAALEDHNSFVNSVAWSPDQTILVTAGADRTVRIYGVTAP